MELSPSGLVEHFGLHRGKCKCAASSAAAAGSVGDGVGAVDCYLLLFPEKLLCPG